MSWAQSDITNIQPNFNDSTKNRNIKNVRTTENVLKTTRLVA